MKRIPVTGGAGFIGSRLRGRPLARERPGREPFTGPERGLAQTIDGFSPRLTREGRA